MLAAKVKHYGAGRFGAGLAAGIFTGAGTATVTLNFANAVLTVTAFAIAALRSAIARGVCAFTSV